jgi:hypothetical protein
MANTLYMNENCNCVLEIDRKAERIVLRFKKNSEKF